MRLLRTLRIARRHFTTLGDLRTRVASSPLLALLQL